MPIKFYSGAYFFQAWAWNLRLGTSSLKSFPEDLYSRFFRPKKIHRTQSGLNLRTLDLEASTLPRNHRWLVNICVKWDLFVLYTSVYNSLVRSIVFWEYSHRHLKHWETRRKRITTAERHACGRVWEHNPLTYQGLLIFREVRLSPL